MNDLTSSNTTWTRSKPSNVPDLLMVFTGQGAQWPKMGGCLINNNLYPIFKKTIQSLDAYLHTLDEAPSWHIEEELLKEAESSRLESAEIAQPLCTAVQIALVDLFASVGVEADAVVGHSSGEVAAAYAAGALTANEAITVAYCRGLVTKLQTKPGAMVAIGTGADDVQKYLQPGAVVACENSPYSITIAGDSEPVHAVLNKIKKLRPDLLTKELHVDKAYHCSHMTEIGPDYLALLEDKISPKNPTKLFFSSVATKILAEGSSFGPEYWQRNLEMPVLFNSTVAAILEHKISDNLVILEIGPHAALRSCLKQIQTQLFNFSPYVPSLMRGKDDMEAFLCSIEELHGHSVSVDFSKAIASQELVSELPTSNTKATVQFIENVLIGV